MLFDTLRECNAPIKEINLLQNDIDDDCMPSLVELLSFNEDVESLTLSSNKLSDKSIELLSDCLSGNTTLKTLLLNGNIKITDESAPFLMNIAKASGISSIDVRATNIAFSNLQELQKLLCIPIEQRELPIKSNTKSAAKISASILY